MGSRLARFAPPVIALVVCLLVFGLPTSTAARDPLQLRVEVDGVERTALVIPGRRSGETPSPLVLFFHGYGDNVQNFAAATRLHDSWPEATFVYPQGLDVTDGRGNSAPGWQSEPGHRSDRDLAFVDAILDNLDTDLQIDRDHLYAGGFSNGGFFTFVLMAARPDEFAAFAPVAAFAVGDHLDKSMPRPVLYIFGRVDKAFDDGMECAELDERGLGCARRTLDRLKTLNRATGAERSLGRGGVAYLHEPDGAPTLWYLHPGGHVWPKFASRTIVKFFSDHAQAKNPDALVDPANR